MPPASFFSLTARSTASFSLDPMAAASPVSGPNTPILMVWADAGGAAAAVSSAAMHRDAKLSARIVGSPVVGADAVKRPLSQRQDAGHADEQLQSHRENRADQREAEHVQPVGIVLDERNGAKECHNDETGDQGYRHVKLGGPLGQTGPSERTAGSGSGRSCRRRPCMTWR